MDKKISTLEYNNRAVYDCLSNSFTDELGSPALHLRPITIDDRPRLHKRSRYTPDLLLATISVASENYVSTLIAPSYSPDILPSDYPNTVHVMKKGVPFQGRVHIGY